MNSLFYCIDKQPKTINNVLRLNFLEFIYFGKYLIKLWLFEKENKNAKRFNNHDYCTPLQGKIWETCQI